MWEGERRQVNWPREWAAWQKLPENCGVVVWPEEGTGERRSESPVVRDFPSHGDFGSLQQGHRSARNLSVESVFIRVRIA